MKLEIKNMEKSFGEKEVLKGISFSADSGEAFGLLGRNGAGKTTTIRILMDVFPANAGEILIDGSPIDYEKMKIGYLPEERGLYPKKKIIEQLVYFATLHGMGKKEATATADYWLDRLDMAQYKNKRLDTLSKGNQQKIQLITALAHNPQIVILDEPFSGLDPVNAMLLKDVVKEEIAKGKIVLFSSHQMNYIEEFCNKIAILNEGKIVLQGKIHDIKHDYTRDKLVVRSEQNKDILSELGDCCSQTEAGELLIQLDSPDKKQEVMQYLTRQYDIDEIKVFEPSLNDIFVEYTGGEETGGEQK
ncbi:MAG: ATP-binding cassette domain-containing protein [Roseburia sp.]|nr:ATP-binding cassette domain-containing protein [Roseburia sp.]